MNSKSLLSIQALIEVSIMSGSAVGLERSQHIYDDYKSGDKLSKGS